MPSGSGGSPTVRGEVDLNKMQTDLAVLTERTVNIDRAIGAVSSNIDKALATFATKDELRVVRDGLDAVKSWLSWVAKIVLGAVVIALIGLVVSKGGVPHP